MFWGLDHSCLGRLSVVFGGRVSPTPSIVLSSPSVRQQEGQKARPSYMRSEGSVCFLAAVELGVFEWEEGW